ncbi:MAG: hypothetical protein PW843_17505 [Azospirillaceae bacterium]|nr:hypothetical protein [Azospirillaceae bacterium]
MRWRRLGVVALCLPLAGCFYTGERQWTYGGPVSHGVARIQAVADGQAMFPQLLRACVAANDPGRLADLDAGKEYPTSGWFIDNDRHDAVLRCMRAQRWDLRPTTLLMP